LYEKVLNKDPKHAVAGNNLAWILATQTNNPERAYAVLQQIRRGRFSDKPAPAERINPEVLDTLGLVYQKLAKPELYPEMRDVFEAARKRYPLDPRMTFFLGEAFAGLGEKKRAQEMYDATVLQADAKARSTLSLPQRQEVLQAVQVAQQKLRP
jgi:hypothetical protein